MSDIGQSSCVLWSVLQTVSCTLASFFAASLELKDRQHSVKHRGTRRVCGHSWAGSRDTCIVSGAFAVQLWDNRGAGSYLDVSIHAIFIVCVV
jgi:hypothetical protein